MAIIFPYEPDWATAVEMEREYKTEIIESRDMTEQRKAHRKNPRRTISFDVRSNKARGEDIVEYLEDNAQQPFWVPDHTRTVLLGEAAQIGASEMIVKGLSTEDTNVPYWLQPGAKMILGHGTDALKELVTISAVAGDTITLVDPVAYEWPANTMCRMAMLGRFEQEMSARWLTLTAGTFSFVFMEDPNDTYDEVYRSQRDDLWFDGREVWLRKPNWREPVGAGVQGYLATLKTDKGVFSHRSHQPVNTRTWQATYTALSTKAAEELIQFAHRKRGQQHSFWMPTWRGDMVLAGETLAGGTLLTVDGTTAFDRHNGSEFINRVAVFFEDGTYEFNTVDSMVTASGDTEITMKYAWSKDITYAGVYRICWMPLWRLASDKLNLIWETNRVAEAKIAIQQVRADHTDDGYFPLTEVTDTWDVSGPTRTYGLTDMPLISTGSVLGSVDFLWSTTAEKTSDGTPAEVQLVAALSFYKDSGGSVGAQIGSTETIIVTDTGDIEIAVVRDIPAGAGYFRAHITRNPTLPGDTTYVYGEYAVNFRGKP